MMRMCDLPVVGLCTRLVREERANAAASEAPLARIGADLPGLVVAQPGRNPCAKSGRAILGRNPWAQSLGAIPGRNPGAQSRRWERAGPSSPKGEVKPCNGRH